MSKRLNKLWYESVTIWYNTFVGLAALVAQGFADTSLQGSILLATCMVCATNITLRLFATTDIK